MAITAAAITGIGTALVGLGEKLLAKKIARDAAFDAALEKLLKACDHTTSYVKRLDLDAKPDLDKEEALAGLWRDASVAFRRIDSNVANTCFLKGRYWLDPSEWTDQQIRDREISLEYVANEAEKLFRHR